MLNVLLEKSGETTPERRKRQSQSKDNTPLWMWRLMEVKSDALRAILHRDLECSVHESRQIGSGQTGDGKSERGHFRNQRTKMDWNGPSLPVYSLYLVLIDTFNIIHIAPSFSILLILL